MTAPGDLTFGVPFRAVFEQLAVPQPVSDLVAGLGDRLDLLTLIDFAADVRTAELPPGDGAELPEVSPEEAAAGLEWYEDAPEEPTVPVDVPLVTVEPLPADPGSVGVRARLEALSDIVIGLPIPGAHLVLGAGGFDVTLRSTGPRFSAEVTMRAALRFDADVLRPMRRTGATSFEPDPSREFTELGLGSVRLTVDGAGHASVRGELRIQLAHPVQLGDTGIVVAAADVRLTPTGEDPGPIDAAAFWKGLFADGTLVVDGLEVVVTQAPDLSLALDAKLVTRNGDLDVAQSFVHRRAPTGEVQPLPLKGLHVGTGCAVVVVDEPDLNRWLGGLVPGLGDQTAAGPVRFALRVLWADGRLTEIRFDWRVTTDRSFALPGVAVTLPATLRFSVLLRDTPGGPRAALLLTFPTGAAITARSTFGWERGGDRELHNDEARATEPPLVGVDLAASRPVTLMLLDVALGRAELPTFLRQLADPLPGLDLGAPAVLCVPTPLGFVSLGGADWDLELALDVDQLRRFTLPFLCRDKEAESASTQFVQIHTPTFPPDAVDFAHQRVRFTVGVTLRIGPLSFDTTCDLAFNWETFALSVDHNAGLTLYSDKAEYGPEEHLGLLWRVAGAADPANPKRFAYFVLATNDGNYQVQQAPGARIELDFQPASKEPITFVVTDFALGSRGLSVTAEVDDKPVELNGLNTRFRFANSRFQVRENRIADFTLAGSGPLPPALVGEATADIALQFHQRDDGNLALVAGAARLQGTKLLHCEGTRFEFAVDALGLKFVDDGRLHLYFTLTGSARFRLAPGDDANGPLALLGNIGIDLIDCPLVGDAAVIGQHVTFLIELPKPKTFDFLGCFTFELRAIAFRPQAPEFGGDPGMEISGQLKFAQGPGDTPDPRPDYHRLLVGLPEPGSVVPRIHFTRVAVNLEIGTAFRLHGAVEFVDESNKTGLLGEGMLQIQGLPTIAASFGFLRVRRDENSPWLRAWFIYLEIRRVSFPIPIVQLYLREVGLGFGYRFTIAGIRAADQAGGVRELITELQALSRTQGDLSRIDRWALDLEDPGQDPRWTIVLRALISQTSAAPSPLSYNEAAEAAMACTFLFDAVIAFRSDLTFLMVVRAWINTNYADYDNNVEGIRERPLFSGFVLLSARQRRFLAHLANTPGAKPGMHPPLPEFVRDAIANSRFSATLLIQPGLLHYELGWPNMLRWSATIGPLKAEFEGGMIFRVSSTELVVGQSFLARAQLSIEAGLDLGFVGVRVSATAKVAFGARFIAVVDLGDPTGRSALYGGIGLEVQIAFSIELWLKIELVFTTIRLSFRFSMSIGFTAALEAGMMGLDVPGLRGVGTLSLSAMGHDLQLSVKVELNGDAVDQARARTEEFLDIGLEATEVEPLPGLGARGPARHRGLRSAAAAFEDLPPGFTVPGYSIFVIRSADADGGVLFALLPRGEAPAEDDDTQLVESGFLPPPPSTGTDVTNDFVLRIPAPASGEPDYELAQFAPSGAGWGEPVVVSAGPSVEIPWRVDWDAVVAPAATQVGLDPATGTPLPAEPAPPLILRRYLAYAFRLAAGSTAENPVPAGDPLPLPQPPADQRDMTDSRVREPSDNSFDAAVRGAFEQFRGSPHFRHDRTLPYDSTLADAFDGRTTIYDRSGEVRRAASADAVTPDQAGQQAHQVRGLVIHDIVADLRDYAAARTDDERARLAAESIAFRMGLVFRVRSASGIRPAWLDQLAGDQPTIRQRPAPDATEAGVEERPVRTFNVLRTDFTAFPPQFRNQRRYSDATTIAIAWELTWEHEPDPAATRPQRDPEHHLAHYQIRRRALGGDEPETVRTVKNGHVLHRSGTGAGDGDVLRRLAPRFQLVDHFADDSEGDLALLPAAGRSYLYTITPVDFGGRPGRPLTLVATRFPNRPPLVPSDAELVAEYLVGPTDVVPTDPAAPGLLAPHRVQVEWTDPADSGATVAVGQYRLLFRREAVLPIGSYGLDSTTQRPPTTLLPTSNARPLPADIAVELAPGRVELSGGHRRVTVEVALDELRAAGVLPRDTWRPEAWRVFVQAVSGNGVPSALAPVRLRLVVGPAAAPPDRTAPVREERQPGELEWLPAPLRLPQLPPRDQRAETDAAHVPLPRAGSGGSGLRFTGGDLSAMAEFRAHPAGTRALRFRWNQGPSGPAGYELGLHAGFRLRRLDLDDLSLDGPTDPATGGRELQEIQLLPAEDLLYAPGDTLATSTWEAWYPGAVQRLRTTGPVGSQSILTPWFSWSESYLEWPAWPGLTEPDGRRTDLLHPFLRAVVDALTATGRTVSVVTTPPMQPGDLSAFLASTAPTVDPYGWGILQRLGLSVALTLHDTLTGAPVVDTALLDAVQEQLDALATTAPDTVDAVRRHLHVELLVQPGRSVRLRPAAVAGADLLGLVQLSLRPAVRQYLRYAAVTLDGPAGAAVELLVNLTGPVSVRNRADPASGQTELLPTGQLVRYVVLLPRNGRADVLMRSAELPAVEAAVALAVPLGGDLPPELAGFVRFDATTGRLITTKSLTPAERDLLRSALPADEVAAADALFAFRGATPFPVTDDRSDEFVVDVGNLATDLAGPADDPLAAQWTRLRQYLAALASTDPKVPVADRIELPAGGPQLAAVLPDVLSWSTRFFTASGALPVDAGGGPVATGDGPWLATAYPRAGSPAAVAPDAGGALTYMHLIEDAWAHNYRFSIQPYSRYELLWQALAAGGAVPAPVHQPPAPVEGGLDVVLDRRHPVDRPLVLSSARLDQAGSPASPAAPGPIWEVIVAQHHEQQLAERNQTVERRLAHRGVAVTVLRRFARPEWPGRLQALTPGFQLDLRPVADTDVAIPTDLPARPDHLDLPRLTPGTALELGLPQRLGAFGEGALALQWTALPFFYEHRLLLIAQAASVASLPNDVTHREFEYRSPLPTGRIEARDAQWMPVAPFGDGVGEPVTSRVRLLHLPLRRFWDSLPDDAQRRWPDERPDPAGSLGPDGTTLTARKVAALPDPDVVYEIVERFVGNVEVQATVSFDATAGRFELRQLGRRVLAGPAPLVPPADPLGDFELEIVLQQVTKLRLGRAYDPAPLPDRIRRRVAFAGELLTVAGVLSPDDLAQLLDLVGDVPDDVAALRTLHRSWDGYEPVSRDPGTLPAALAAVAEVVRPDLWSLVWTGGMSDEQADALRGLDGDERFRAALADLAGQVPGAGTDTVTVTCPPPPGPAPATLTGLTLTIEPDTGRHTALIWTGPLLDAELEALRGWARIPELQVAVTALLAERDAVALVNELPPAPADRPAQDDLPPELVGPLTIEDGRLTWRGRPAAAAQLAALDALAELGDPPFREAVTAVRTTLTQQATSVPLDVAARPTRPPALLGDQLLIGRFRLVFHGLPSRDEARALAELLPEPPDRAAIARLLVAGPGRGMAGRSLLVRTRRGAAPPSDEAELEPEDQL